MIFPCARSIRGFVLLLLVSFTATGCYRAYSADAEAGQPAIATAAASEAKAFALIPWGSWTADKLRDIAQTITTLPADIGVAVLWKVSEFPSVSHSTDVFVSALSSPHAEVRSLAMVMLVGWSDSDGKRFFLSALALEQDEGVVQTAVAGVGHLPLNRAVTNLMEIMLHPGVGNAVLESTGEELRRLTRVHLNSNRPGDWRVWWLDNETYYNI